MRPTDHLAVWQRIRAEVDWAGAVRRPAKAIVGGRDGFVRHVGTVGGARGDRLAAALTEVRASPELSFSRLASWHAVATGHAFSRFRSGPAFAKGGRERYGLLPDTQRVFADCLAEAVDERLPVTARAARAYLDVSFFHPFDDGNARAALLTLYFLLLRDGVVPDFVAPAVSVVRRADDPDGARDYVRLLDALIAGTHARLSSSTCAAATSPVTWV